MKVELQQVAKRFRLEWVLRDVNLAVEAPSRYAVTGPNGAGKSTLLRMLAGHLTPSRGKVHFSKGQQNLEIQQVYRELSYAAPYIEVIEEFTLLESINFHRQFKPFYNDLSAKDLISLLGFQRAAHKPVRHFSSGMKQRLKLALAICADSPLLLLDEPTTNLDNQGAAWYRELIETFGRQRLIIVASNVETDYSYCGTEIDIRQFKN